jgi:hypothetical protein
VPPQQPTAEMLPAGGMYDRFRLKLDSRYLEKKD